MFGLKPLQLLHQVIVLCIRDDWSIFLVIGTLMKRNFCPKLFNTALDCESG
jgi:hypothetical protein